MITAQDIKNAVRDMDIALKPYSIIYHPSDVDKIPQEIMEGFDMVETSMAMPGKIYVVDRKRVKELTSIKWMEL